MLNSRQMIAVYIESFPFIQGTEQKQDLWSDKQASFCHLKLFSLSRLHHSHPI